MTRTRVTCLRCGTEFDRPNGYDGNYCPSCHETWVDADEDREVDDDTEPRGPSPAGALSSGRTDDDEDPPAEYDEE